MYNPFRKNFIVRRYSNRLEIDKKKFRSEKEANALREEYWNLIMNDEYYGFEAVSLECNKRDSHSITTYYK